MPELTLQRIPFTVEAGNRLRTLKSRTGITPNILCRIGFCLSLEEQGLPPELPNNFKVGREINRYTLLGKYDKFFVALLVTRLVKDQMSLTGIDNMFLAHINRGIEILTARVKSIADLSHLG
ncbi:MAG: DNA sulfur modification protein DndE [Desulfobacteraceae bacterium]|nr:DNA sulfur modification protein DndE [Desulfobacteraceae bacterium]